MKTEEVINYFGSCTKAAKALGITKQAVSRWGEYPPACRQYHIEVATQGYLRVEESLLPCRVEPGLTASLDHFSTHR